MFPARRSFNEGGNAQCSMFSECDAQKQYIPEKLNPINP